MWIVGDFPAVRRDLIVCPLGRDCASCGGTVDQRARMPTCAALRAELEYWHRRWANEDDDFLNPMHPIYDADRRQQQAEEDYYSRLREHTDNGHDDNDSSD